MSRRRMLIQKAKVEVDYLCFTANQANSTVTLNRTVGIASIVLEYSTDKINWYDYDVGFAEAIFLENIGDRVYFRRKQDTPAERFSTGSSNYYFFIMTGSISASGNVVSLIDKTCQTLTVPYNCFSHLFYNCKSLTTPPKLPAITTAESQCYLSMFENSSIETAPELPATTLNSYCYNRMFYNCKKLRTAPSLPATELKSSCYKQMFYGCELLLLATSGASNKKIFTCPEYPSSVTDPVTDMFNGCGYVTVPVDYTPVSGRSYYYMS